MTKSYQLVAEVLVPAHVQDRDAKGPLPSGLGVRLRTKLDVFTSKLDVFTLTDIKITDDSEDKNG